MPETILTLSRHHDAHRQAGHVERPERLHAIETALTRDDAYANFLVIDAKPAGAEATTLVHPREYYDRLEAATQAGGARLDPDTYATRGSLNVALEALGGVLYATDAVLSGRVQNGFALVRPPGHHARPAAAMGFCLFANIAIAARWAQRRHDLKRILIVDFDVHHGNGTQEIFYEDPDVLFMSTHQWPLYPGTGALQETGTGKGAGATVNVPLPARTGDAAYLEAFQRILRPIAFRFEPELILVSAGYDAHWMDPIAGMNLTVNGFAGIVREILSWAAELTNNRLVAVLEGGYHADALAYSVLATTRLLHNLEADIIDPFGKGPEPDVVVEAEIERVAEFFGV